MFCDPAIMRPGAVLHERYRLRGVIGEGGFGTVFEALQIATDQTVAVKVLNLRSEEQDFIDEKRLLRFEREMMLCGRLHHPNIVRLLDFGRIDEATVYTVLELVEGKDLSRVLAEEGALEPQELKHLMLQVLEALAYAHAQDVVHRDLKPSNIMIVTSGTKRDAIVLDFGMGALADGAEDDDYVRITLTSELVGTPAYAAPELLRGRRPSPRVDLYSWGLVFLEGLTGQRVNAGASLAEVIYWQLGPDEVPIPPSIAAHPLGEILRAATRKDPQERIGDAAELVATLQRCDVRDLTPSTGTPRAKTAKHATATLAGSPAVDRRK